MGSCFLSWSKLLSGNQDGIVRCFDLRQPTQTRTGATFRSIRYNNADGVHHVQWSPRVGFSFACSTEQGSVLKWDMRTSDRPVLRITAHEKVCTAMAWHPDGIHLVSAGLDSKCHVWDMSKQDNRQKPKWTLSTPAPAGTLAWRPGQRSATAQGKRASQLAMSYDESSQKRYGINVVHIWDLARPTMPYKEIQRFDTSRAPCSGATNTSCGRPARTASLASATSRLRPRSSTARPSRQWPSPRWARC